VAQNFYQKMQKTAQGLFEKFNQGEIRYVIETPGNGPADNPGAPDVSITPLPGATARGVSFKFLNNSGILATDQEIHFAGGIVEPQPQGYFTLDGATKLKIVEIHRQPSAGTVVAWTVIARK